ncbi:MAG: adenylate/guanylate cyclase domain-containing protein [Acidimicrobiia bacterium]|nr:adenylate/guanylate cyclase domain-containing protein [Acidimicrobiia bacterium]
MSSLPEGVVTFLLTDIEGSTKLWEEAPGVMMEAIAEHDAAIDRAIEDFGGTSVKPRGEGDSRFIVFPSAPDAVAAAVRMQANLADIDWDTPRPIRVRASIHTGAAELQLGDYYGSTVNRAARLRSIAHGGQTVMSSSTWELVRDRIPDGVAIEDMGEHSLKDLTRPEHVYQVYPQGVEPVFPPLTSLGSIPNNLPRQLTELVGRQAELQEALRLLKETRLLTILAPGGTGKTRLAIQVAADSTADYPNGVFFVSLADISDPTAVAQAIADSIGLALSTDEDDMNQLLTYLASKSLLLLLDNFEHLLEGAGAVSQILAGAPNVTVLATSRSKLNVGGETTLTIGGLATTWESPEDALATDGVRLFMDAARRTAPDLTLEMEDLDALERILTLTGGMPLAILLAAAWVDMLPISEIADEVQKSLDFLETESGDVPDRHRSVRAVFDYSWQLLTDREKESFAALSVFRGGFTREAAEVAAGTSLRSLAGLVAKTLITPSVDKSRYSVHELLRQYAEDELKGNPARFRDVQDAHARYFADMSDRAFEMVPQSDEVGLVALFEADLENTRTAWRHLVKTGDASGLRKMLPSMYVVYEIRSWYLVGLGMIEDAIQALAGDSGDQTVLLTRHLATAIATWFGALLGRPSVEDAVEANRYLRESQDHVALWIGLQCEALNCTYLGLYDQMIEVTNEIISFKEKTDEPFYGVAGHNWRSRAALYKGDLETAKNLLGEALSLLEERNEHYFMVWNLGLQGAVARLTGRPEDALVLQARQVERARDIGYRRGEAVALHGLGSARLAVGDLEGAEDAFTQAIVACEKVGMLIDMLGLAAYIAHVRGRLGSEIEAVELLSTVLAEPLSNRQGIMDNTPIIDFATEWLDELRARLDGTAFSEASERGSARPYEVAVKEIIEGIG